VGYGSAIAPSCSAAPIHLLAWELLYARCGLKKGKKKKKNVHTSTHEEAAGISHQIRSSLYSL